MFKCTLVGSKGKRHNRPVAYCSFEGMNILREEKRFMNDQIGRPSAQPVYLAYFFSVVSRDAHVSPKVFSQ